MSQAIVIFGATGDLSREKLFPALFNLYKENLLKDTDIIAFSRRDWKDSDFCEYIKPYLEKRGDKKEINNFLKIISYHKSTFEDKKGYSDLHEKIKDKESVLFYLSVSPEYYNLIIRNLVKEKKSKILIEKPFGLDTETAYLLEEALREKFDEDEIYRIDHYLAKSQVLNILELKLHDNSFAEFFTNKNLKEIKIKLFEKKDIGTRGQSYDKVGALIDVGQNHLLQVLATVLMIPDVFEIDTVRGSRMKALLHLKVVDYIAGQYEGYKEHDGVDRNSKTETYFKLKLKSENPDLKNIDIYLETGKAMLENLVEIECVDKKDNILKIEIQPEHNIAGFDEEITKKLSQKRKEAYEQLFFDALRTNNELFPSFDEIVQAWSIIDSIKKKQNKKLIIYKKNSII